MSAPATILLSTTCPRETSSTTPGAPNMPSEKNTVLASTSNADNDPPDPAQPHYDQEERQQQHHNALRPLPSPLDTMRAYRACLNCRNRKSKCDLDINQGRPPCRRCQREAKDCVLGESHRGGRRVRKKPRLDDVDPRPDDSSPSLTFQSSLQTPTTPLLPGLPASGKIKHSHNSHPTQNAPQMVQPLRNQYSKRQESTYEWQQQPTPADTTSSDSINVSRNIAEKSNLLNHPNTPSFQHRGEPTGRALTGTGDRTAVHENIASADLQNPSDALDILAQVADRVDDGDSSASDQNRGNLEQQHIRPISRLPESNVPKVDDYFHYKPVQDGLMSPEMIYHLFSSYEEFFHPFFPIIPRETFDRTRLPWLSRYEPHLFSAILTVASKDNERVHQVCYNHNQQLISMLLAGTDANVEAVEALLLLSQWVSHRPQASIAVGRGEEDRVAWMYIGTALRLGYFLGIDRTSFRNDSGEAPAIYNRKRLVWSACYICDRQVSVRLGKGFWARGPGPLSGLKSSDFPTLQPTVLNSDNWALIFQANLELTQIFSNVHDILYSSKGHGWKEMLEGRYTKYLDDFRTSIRSWNDIWGTLICSPRLKASLLLTYDYLRLYVNAFAYQATISRALTFQRDSQHTPNRPLPLINASAPDARFIYEALDAAKSLLSTFNNFVDPETLRYMPSPYYLFIIYSAVFLYKARSTTTMTEEERTSVRHMINQTIDRLQKASVGANHMGSRYARLLQLLWRKAPRRNADHNAQHASSMDDRLNLNEPSSNNPQASHFDPNGTRNFSDNMGVGNMGGNDQFQPRPSGAFSWLDLGATWNFATQNNNLSGSTGDSDNEMMLDSGPSPFDMGDFGAFTDYSLLEGDNPNLIF